MPGHKIVLEPAQEAALVQIALQVLTLVTIQELLQAVFQVAHRAPLVVTRAERVVEQEQLPAVCKATEPETSKT